METNENNEKKTKEVLPVVAENVKKKCLPEKGTDVWIEENGIKLKWVVQ